MANSTAKVTLTPQIAKREAAVFWQQTKEILWMCEAIVEDLPKSPELDAFTEFMGRVDRAPTASPSHLAEFKKFQTSLYPSPTDEAWKFAGGRDYPTVMSRLTQIYSFTEAALFQNAVLSYSYAKLIAFGLDEKRKAQSTPS